ncbi:MAG: hypothetical protein VR78_15625 [Hoeflea sp. BRH_c9]|nr:MAG: hypothetical protein VR78_15625 [Hoeflea sp. BRH_c9]
MKSPVWPCREYISSRNFLIIDCVFHGFPRNCNLAFGNTAVAEGQAPIATVDCHQNEAKASPD